MGDVIGSEATGQCIDLDGTAVDQVKTFMAAAARAFAIRDAGLLELLAHSGGDPQGRKNSRDFNQSLMDGGDTVKSWSAQPYTEPKWSIMRTRQHHPPPAIWVDVILSDGTRDYPYCFALASSEDGQLLSCYYIERIRRRKPKV